MKIACNGNGPEIFFSIQGEGKSVGRPSVFVRTSLCNLHCVWCDTDYTWNWTGTGFTHVRDSEPGYEKYDKNREIVNLPVEDVADCVASFDCRNVVLTGGEPMLHQSDLTELMRRLRERDSGYWFEVETNGTLRPTEPFDQQIDQYNVSIKLANSGVAERLRLVPDAVRDFAASNRAVFKFVVATREELESEILPLLETNSVSADRVWLMPEGQTSDEVRRRFAEVVDACRRYGFNFSDRLHLHIFGAKRGV